MAKAPGQSRCMSRGLPLAGKRAFTISRISGLKKRPAHSLSTLRRHGQRRKTLLWLSDQLCRTGRLTPKWAPMHGFGLFTSCAQPSPGALCEPCMSNGVASDVCVDSSTSGGESALGGGSHATFETDANPGHSSPPRRPKPPKGRMMPPHERSRHPQANRRGPRPLRHTRARASRVSSRDRREDG